jgi:CBS domain-containing protein
MTIYLGESDSWRGRSLYMSILETLRKAGIAGATASRGLAGFGAHSHLHTAAIERLSMDLPVIISVIDTTENVDRALALVRPMVREGLITLEEVEIVKYSHRYLQPLPADRPVSDVMTRQVTSVKADTPAVEIVELLLGSELFKAVPVVDAQKHVIGIITDGDLLRKAGMPARLAVGERLGEEELQQFISNVRSEKTASEIMTSPVVTAKTDEALGHVVHRMLERDLKRVPVVDNKDRLVGMMSRLDILRATAGNGEERAEHAPLPKAGKTIGELMTAEVPTVYVSDDLSDVLDRIIKADIKRVVVLDEQGRAVGLITDGDLVARVGPVERGNILQVLAARVIGTDMRRFDISARELMSEHVLSASPDTSIPEAIAMMLREARKRLVVVDDNGRPIGIVDRQTLMAASLGV